MRKIACIDMDAFFPSIEQRDNPLFRGLPVIVGADPKKGRGVVASASYEARKFGIHAGMPITKAYRILPDAIYIRPHYSHYLAESKKIMGLLREYSPVVEEASIDEAFIDLTGCEKLFGSAEDVAMRIKVRIKSELGLPCTVGLAPNKFLAKLASKLGKPDGFLVVPQDKVLDFLDPLPVESILGIGEKTAEHLYRLGVRKMKDLRMLPIHLLKHEFGVWGITLYNIARGKDDSPLIQGRKPKQISSEMTLEYDTDDIKIVRSAFHSLAKDVAFRLKEEKMLARVVFAKLRYADFTTKIRSAHFKEPISGMRKIFEIGWKLLETIGWGKIRLVGIGVADLVSPVGLPLPLFPDIYEKESELEKTILELQKKFGRNILTTSDELEFLKNRLSHNISESH